MTREEIEKAIETVKIAIAEAEWNCPIDYALSFETAIKCMETVAKIPLVIETLENAADVSNDSILEDLSKSLYYDGEEEGINFAIRIIKEKLCGGAE